MYTTMQVIVNCRLLYIVMLSAFNICVLALWSPYLQTPFMGHSSSGGGSNR